MGQIVSKVAALFVTVGLCLSLLFVEKKHAALVCKAIELTIKDHPGQSFITRKEIINLLQATDQNTLRGKPLKSINTYAIQHQLKNHPLIQNVLVYKSWNGTLKICLTTKCFIARIVRPLSKPICDAQCLGKTQAPTYSNICAEHSAQNCHLAIESQKRSIGLMEPSNSQTYLDEQGRLITLKDPPPLRLLVVAGENIVTEKSKLCDKGLLALLHFIYRNAFWSRQITSLEVAANGTIILGTQVGGHQIEFEKAESIEEKFEKLQLFYSQVIPYKGWKAYHRVNVAFKNQLICE
ncbi:MAG: hypothetical protein NMK33_04535 [Candidatus Cardinium sp.]|uniref:cell division protein FtsQ/DivIB n=1 Tax=Cardinium endosymbiont of Dermatophagoides farinae TaxID=2597823 RepID=UPI001182A8F5|nr:hypothetical protein [Cardinium endosymbiont of Dermatophagoides farinae]TSJ80700.1 hypothetical protein FPG78_01300 [Cardinium endosymbiont of Dermatophagoides farinae]UWW96694.1 MAG: hypothetical protein NMK33_04535 [Candidatus Cardinium sp.]